MRGKLSNFDILVKSRVSMELQVNIDRIWVRDYTMLPYYNPITHNLRLNLLF